MNQREHQTNESREPEEASLQAHTDLLGTITVDARAPEFADPGVAERYFAGHYTSRLDAELADILSHSGEKSSPEASPNESTISIQDPEALSRLNTIAIIQGGQVLPILDISELPTTPLSKSERIRLLHQAAQALLLAVEAALDDRIERHQLPHGDDEAEGNASCHA